MDNKDVVIDIKDIYKKFGQRQILSGSSLEVYRGETMVIMGGSGCGKSTLLRHMIGAIKPDKGSVHVMGKNIANLGEEELDAVKKKFGMLFQSGALFDSLSVKENVAMPLRENTKLDDQIISIMVKMKLELVGLRGFEDLMPAQLSGGMKKRVGLARAIVMDPEIVFYDEPTTGLDPIMAGVIDKLILDLSKKLSITSVVVTHDMKSVFRIADRIAMLHEGKVVEVGLKDAIKNTTNPIVKQFINGDTEGPINLFMDKDNYLEELTK
ncbi:MAG: ABC transporter ATP-binding protein [Candidatus Omnitrophica bacterium]|nr:ABC transporter ATP-binding protein [Candidatus Omnitrophota bacterium]